MAVVGLQLMYKGTTWQGLCWSIWKRELGLLREEGPWHKPCFFSWEGADENIREWGFCRLSIRDN